jgi:hypothetical protein
MSYQAAWFSSAVRSWAHKPDRGPPQYGHVRHGSECCAVNQGAERGPMPVKIPEH